MAATMIGSSGVTSGEKRAIDRAVAADEELFEVPEDAGLGVGGGSGMNFCEEAIRGPRGSYARSGPMACGCAAMRAW